MKFFTPDLLERFGSDDDGVALTAQEELERRSERYSRHLRDLEDKLPPRFREMLQSFYLHDARVVGTDLSGCSSPLPLFDFEKLKSGAPTSSEAECLARSFWIPLQLDTPPRMCLVLHYRSVTIEEAVPGDASTHGDPCLFLEWQYDEVDVIPSTRGTEFRHSILFTNGCELRLRFSDFDFATLKPVTAATEIHNAGVLNTSE